MEKCIHCGSGDLRETEESDAMRVGHAVFEGPVRALRCARCASVYLDGPSLEAFEARVVRMVAEQGVVSGEGMRLLRKSAGLKAADAAALLDVSAETWSAWETGKRPIPLAAWTVLSTLVLDPERIRPLLDRARSWLDHPGRRQKFAVA